MDNSEISSQNWLINLKENLISLIFILLSFCLFWYFGKLVYGFLGKVLFKMDVERFNLKRAGIIIVFALINLLPFFIYFSVKFLKVPGTFKDFLINFYVVAGIFFNLVFLIPVLYNVLEEIKFNVEFKRYLYLFLYLFFPIDLIFSLLNVILSLILFIYMPIIFLSLIDFKSGFLSETLYTISLLILLALDYLLLWYMLGLGKGIILKKPIEA